MGQHSFFVNSTVIDGDENTWPALRVRFGHKPFDPLLLGSDNYFEFEGKAELIGRHYNNIVWVNTETGQANRTFVSSSKPTMPNKPYNYAPPEPRMRTVRGEEINVFGDASDSPSLTADLFLRSGNASQIFSKNVVEQGRNDFHIMTLRSGPNIVNVLSTWAPETYREYSDTHFQVLSEAELEVLAETCMDDRKLVRGAVIHFLQELDTKYLEDLANAEEEYNRAMVAFESLKVSRAREYEEALLRYEDDLAKWKVETENHDSRLEILESLLRIQIGG